MNVYELETGIYMYICLFKSLSCHVRVALRHVFFYFIGDTILSTHKLCHISKFSYATYKIRLSANSDSDLVD